MRSINGFLLALAAVFGNASASVIAAQNASPTPEIRAETVAEKVSDNTDRAKPSPAPVFKPVAWRFKDNAPFTKKTRSPATTAAQTSDALPSYLKDRGTGLPTSQFGTYIRKGETIVYPFFEYYRDHDFEYKPEEFGFAGNDTDFRGRYRAREALIFVAYGLTDNIAVEFEAATIKASLEKSPLDTSAMPARIEESGLGDIEGQIRWRWNKESKRRPEFFSYTELVIPHNKGKRLIGTQGVELKFGSGMIKGFKWGTMTFRAAVEYDSASDSKVDFGEFAVEYLKRLSPNWRLYLGVEGTPDELSVIPELQWHINRRVFVKFNSGFGATSKATDWAPEVGIVFTLGGKQ